MTVQETLLSIFPIGQLRGLDLAGFGGFAINGLAAGTVPQNCEVLLTGEEVLPLSPMDRRTFYLVKANDILFYFRICTAMAGSGYAEYAAGLGIADGPEAQTLLIARARNYIESCCAQAAA